MITQKREIPERQIQSVSLRVVREYNSILYPQRKVTTPDEAVLIFREFIGDLDREMFCVLTLDSKNHPTALQRVSLGTLNASIVHPREVFKFAILSNAASIIACHNHPSGDPTPSIEDISISERLHESGQLLGIELLDHIILGQNQFSSMKERGVI